MNSQEWLNTINYVWRDKVNMIEYKHRSRAIDYVSFNPLLHFGFILVALTRNRKMNRRNTERKVGIFQSGVGIYGISNTFSNIILPRPWKTMKTENKDFLRVFLKNMTF
uniref:Uncharacterized protein n=1 Tax=Lepeophtheirus salmonis TaxID=72036 RepID=A0A0K2T5V5_LEPSM